MPGEFFFMSMGGLGMSLAGFGGLLAALTPKKAATSGVSERNRASAKPLGDSGHHPVSSGERGARECRVSPCDNAGDVRGTGWDIR